MSWAILNNWPYMWNYWFGLEWVCSGPQCSKERKMEKTYLNHSIWKCIFGYLVGACTLGKSGVRLKHKTWGANPLSPKRVNIIFLRGYFYSKCLLVSLFALSSVTQSCLQNKWIDLNNSFMNQHWWKLKYWDTTLPPVPGKSSKANLVLRSFHCAAGSLKQKFGKKLTDSEDRCCTNCMCPQLSQKARFHKHALNTRTHFSTKCLKLQYSCLITK